MTPTKEWIRSSKLLLFYTLPKIFIEHAHARNPQNLRNSDEIGRKGLRQKFHTLKLVSLPRNPTYIQLHGDLSKHKLKSSYQDFQNYKQELREDLLECLRPPASLLALSHIFQKSITPLSTEAPR